MIRKLLVVIATATLLSGCQTTPVDDIETESSTDPKANISGYKTYSWLGAAAIISDPDGRWHPPQFDAEAEIENGIDEQLKAHGFTESDVAPDMYVVYSVGVDMAALEIEQDPESGVDVLETVPEGALVIALVDSDTGFAIWAGAASADIRELGPDAARERIAYAIKEMFKDLPK